MNPIFYVIFSYVSLSFLIVILSLKLSDYIDLLDKKTNLSGAFLGAVLLAIVTSLPELFTSLSSVLFLNESGMVIGNILGSNSFDVLILGVCILSFYTAYKKDHIDFKSHITVCIGLVAMYICLIVPLLLGENQLLLGSINVCFIVVAVIYAITLWRMPKKDNDTPEMVEIKKPANVEVEPTQAENIKGINLSVKQIVLRFVICSVLLVGVSILITYTTNDLADYFNLETSTAGVLFLAIATSLPEVVSTISLCHKGNFDASFGNILGSCLFNTFVLTFSELIYFKGSILVPNDFASIKLVLLNLVSVLTFVGILLLKRKNKEFKFNRAINYVLSVVLILAYAMYYVI